MASSMAVKNYKHFIFGTKIGRSIFSTRDGTKRWESSLKENMATKNGEKSIILNDDSIFQDRNEDVEFTETSRRMIALANDFARENERFPMEDEKAIDEILQQSNFDTGKLSIDQQESNRLSTWPPSSPFAQVPNLKSVHRDDRNKLLHVLWENGIKAKFSYVWLRDNCPAPHTYQLTDMCKARKMVMSELELNVEPRVVENRRDHVYVEWPGNKISVYESKWLALRNLDDTRLRVRRRQIMLDEKVHTWGRDEIERNTRWYDFERVLKDDRSLHDALMELVNMGILFIDKAPAKVGQLRRLADRIGFEYMTHYGKIFTVKSDANPSNVAYTSGGLGLHTDLPYLEYAPQIQALHCIEQVRTKGGENQFADGFHVAEHIRQRDPDAYRILSTVPLEYVDDGRDHIQFDLTYRRPVFNFDHSGRLIAVHFSNQQRSWFYDVPVEELYSVYKALKTFDDYMRSPENMLELKMLPGQIVLFHNLRVLHGRSTFQMTQESGGRHMEGCYFNWDFAKSQIRILRDRLNIEPNQISV